jgi:hypothetical protein
MDLPLETTWHILLKSIRKQGQVPDEGERRKRRAETRETKRASSCARKRKQVSKEISAYALRLRLSETSQDKDELKGQMLRAF